VRGDVDVAQIGNELSRIIGLVGAERDPVSAIEAPQHGQRGLAFGGAGGLGQKRIDDQAVAVFHKDMAHVTWSGGLTLRFLVKACVGIGGRGMGCVAALFLAKIALGVPALGIGRSAATRIVAIVRVAILGLEALHARPGIDQRAVHREMLGRQQRPNPRWLQHGGHEFGRNIARHKPVPVLGEHRYIPDGRIHRQPDKPTEHQVVIELLH